MALFVSTHTTSESPGLIYWATRLPIVREAGTAQQQRGMRTQQEEEPARGDGRSRSFAHWTLGGWMHRKGNSKGPVLNNRRPMIQLAFLAAKLPMPTCQCVCRASGVPLRPKATILRSAAAEWCEDGSLIGAHITFLLLPHVFAQES